MDDLDGLFEGVAEFVGEVFEALSFSSDLPDPSTVAAAAPLTDEQKRALKKTPILPGFEEGAKYRVKANDWWDGITTDDVLVVNISTSTHVIFNRPNGEILSVPNGVIDDFERIENGT
jgi:hypothetical protein